MRLINKLKRLIGIPVSEYTIFYTNPLSVADKTKLVNNMIGKFSSACRPNSIMVGTQTAIIDFQNPCLTGEQLKNISNNTLGPNPAEVSRITLDGNQIWSK